MIVAGGIAGDVNHVIKPRLSVIVAGVNHAIEQGENACSVPPFAPNRD